MRLLRLPGGVPFMFGLWWDRGMMGAQRGFQEMVREESMSMPLLESDQEQSRFHRLRLANIASLSRTAALPAASPPVCVPMT